MARTRGDGLYDVRSGSRCRHVMHNMRLWVSDKISFEIMRCFNKPDRRRRIQPREMRKAKAIIAGEGERAKG